MGLGQSFHVISTGAKARWAGPGQTIHLAGQSVEGGARIGPARPLSFPGGEMDMVPLRFRNCDSYMMVVISCYFIALGDSEWRYLYIYSYIYKFYISYISISVSYYSGVEIRGVAYETREQPNASKKSNLH
jgi:hypothetical protein